jgi:hypothetical protein
MAAVLTLSRASPSSVTNRRYWIRTTAPGRSSLRQPPQPQRSAVALLDRCRGNPVISLASTTESDTGNSTRRGGKKARGGKKGGDGGGGRGDGGGTFRVSEVKLPWRLDPGKVLLDPTHQPCATFRLKRSRRIRRFATFDIHATKRALLSVPGALLLQDSFDVSPALIAAVAKRMGIASKVRRALAWLLHAA